MRTAEKALDELVTLLKEKKKQEAITLCATAFGSTEALVRELAELMTESGFAEMALAIARTLDAPDEARPKNALAISLVCEREFIFDPDNAGRLVVLEKAKRLAKLSP